MALNVLYYINLLSSISPWSSGDSVIVYWDDVNNSFVVKRNGSTETTGPDLGTLETYVAYKKPYQFCEGTTLNTFQLIGNGNNPYFPYVEKVETTNSKYCSTNSVSNLVFTSIVVSDAFGSTDGSVSITADNGGASTIEYAINEFTVPYGSGNTTGIFSGLSAGVYFAKARDSSGQIISQKFQIDEIGYSSVVKINSISGTAPTTTGGSDGTITVSASGDGTPFTYVLKKSGSIVSTNATGSFSSLSAGVYNISVTDTFNWTAYGSYELIDPLICDLEITDTTFTHVTSQGGNDGSITITATSSNGPIEYSLGAFTGSYGTGSGTNTFTGLSAGKYTVYVRDSACLTAVTGSILDGASLTEYNYNTLYRLEYDDLSGYITRFDINKKGYTGSIEEVNGGAEPLIYSKPEADSNNIFEPIHSSYVSVTLESDTNFKFRDLYTSDEKQYLGKWYKDTGNGFELYWIGFLQPEVFTEPYLPPPYDVTLKFTDGIALLKRKPYIPENASFGEDLSGYERYGGSVSIIKILSNILSKTGLTLPYSVAINMYEDSFNSADTDDPLKQTYIDQKAFYPDDEPMDCLTALSEILKPFGARIFQWKGEWKIRRVKEEIATYDFRRFSYTGQTSLNGSFNPIINYDSFTESGQRVHAINNSLNYEVQPSYKKIKINQILGKKESILLNNNFNKFVFDFGQVGGDTYYDYDEWLAKGGGLGYVRYSVNEWQLKLNGGTCNDNIKQTDIDDYSLMIEYSGNGAITNDTKIDAVEREITWRTGDKIKIDFEVAVDKLKSFPFLIIRCNLNINDEYWLGEDGLWRTNDFDLRFYPSPKNEFINLSVEAELPEVSNVVTKTLKFSIYPYQASVPDFGSWYNGVLDQDGETAFRAFQTTDKPTGYKVSVFSNTISDTDKTGYFDSPSLDDIRNNFLFYELRSKFDLESEPDVIVQDDFDTSGNIREWLLVGQTYVDPNDPDISAVGSEVSAVPNTRFYINNVNITHLPNGIESPEEANYSVKINEKASETLQYELYFGDLGDNRLSKDQYTNFFTESDGTLTSSWTRDGVSESNYLQNLSLAQMGFQYNTPSSKVTGSITGHNPSGTSLFISPEYVIKETQDNNKGYWLSELTIMDKSSYCDVKMVELKGTTGSSGDSDEDDGGSGNAGFSLGFSLGYNS